LAAAAGVANVGTHTARFTLLGVLAVSSSLFAVPFAAVDGGRRLGHVAQLFLGSMLICFPALQVFRTCFALRREHGIAGGRRVLLVGSWKPASLLVVGPLCWYTDAMTECVRTSDRDFDPPPRRGHGCLFYGGITAIVLLLVAGIGGYLAVTGMLDHAAAMVLEYPETSPMPIGRSAMPMDEYRELEQRVRAFGADRAAGRTPAPLELDSDDLNALIAYHPSWQALRDWVHLELEGDRVRADVALPTDLILADLPGMAKVAGRYLNGTATIHIALTDGVLWARLIDLDIRGKQPSEQFLTSLRARNLLAEQQNGSEIADARGAIESLTVADGVLRIVGKPR